MTGPGGPLREGDAAPGDDAIDEGRRLIRLDGDKGVSLAERLANRLHLLTWRTPLHGFRLRGRFPLKLLTVPEDPIPGDRAAGEALLGGSFSHRGQQVAVADLDFTALDLPAPYVDYIHGFGWLRDLGAAATRRDAAPIAESIMRRWLVAHGERASDPAWRFDLVGKRIMAWAAHAPLILSSSDHVYRSAVLNTLARSARHLDKSADRAAIGAPRIAAWSGLVAAGLLIPGGEPRRMFGEAGLQRALAAAVFDDGGLSSRSPVAQLDAVATLAMLRAVYDVRRLEWPDPIQQVLQRMVAALAGVCHGDGGLGSWQGGAPIGGARVSAIVGGTGVRARPLRRAREWGYQRLSAGDTVVIVDAAPPPVARLTAGGCASTLAMELSDGPRRLIVNCGGGAMTGARVPRHLAEGLRTTAAHSTLTVSDSNSTAIHADGTLGRGVGEVEVDRQESEGGSRLEISHDGYARRFGLLHRRSLTLTGDGRELRGEDLLLPARATRASKKGPATFTARFHLAPGVEVSPTADGLGGLLRLLDGPLWQFRVRGAALGIEESLWIDADGRPRATWQLVASGEAPAGGASFSWTFKRMG